MSRDPRVVPNPLAAPATTAAPELVEELFRHPREGACAYKLLTVRGWTGQLVTNVLFRVRYVGDDLYTEAEYRVLTPVAGLDEAIERVMSDPWRRFDSWVRLFFSVPLVAAAAPLRTVRRFVEGMDEKSVSLARAWDAQHNRFYDRGGSASVRALVGESFDGAARYRVYLEYLDREMYLKVIERQLVEGLADALDSFGVDSSVFRSRSSVIYNSGVIVGGATINGENVSIGNQSIAAQVKDAVGSAVRRVTDG
jgi:hypothetical protein